MEETIFQIIDILSDDIQITDDNKEYVLTFYGKTENDLDVVCNVVGFKPYFFLRVPENWGRSSVRCLLKNINVFINSYKKGSYRNWNGNYIDELLDVKYSRNFYGYNYDVECEKIKEYKFAKISFDNLSDMRKCLSAIQDFYKSNYNYSQDGKIVYEYKNKKPKITSIDAKMKRWFNQEHNCECLCNLYESKLPPHIRFLHEKNIESCGWVSVKYPKNKLVQEDDKIFNVDIELNNISIKNINHIKKDQIAGFKIASFDIECDSSHGDFPNPIKDFKKVAIDIHESYFRTSQMYNSPSMKKLFIRKCIEECFNGGSDNIQSIYTINGKYTEDSLNEIMEKFTESFIERIDTSKESSKSRDSVITDMGIILDKIKNDKGEEIKIKGDPIIQIGTVFHKYGDKKPYNRSMVIIGNEDKPDEKICDDIPGVEVLECNSEKELLLKWKDLILYHNPDVITGYNIFGFDFDYINKRVDYLFPCCSKCKKNKTYSNCSFDCPKNDFYRLGRLMRNRESDRIKDIHKENKTLKSQRYYNNHWEKRCQVQSKQLSSSGLGDNLLKYISMDGRIVFDIQKEIQKGHPLESYKLDDVSSHFMKGKVIETWLGVDPKLKRKITRIKTNTLGNLKENDYITFNIITKYGIMPYNNKQKFKVLGINNSKDKNYIGVDGNIKNIEKKFKNELISYEWCLAKDDISPQQIFDFHKNGGSSGRSKVAKYCIMDCELCIHLLLQLDLIPNNIGMASVSWVPLSYIFLRGQGIKINSIITRECSKVNTLIPTLKGFDDSVLDDGFEGAIVLEPTPGIYLDDPVSVLDYASLYPSSIIEKNLSHETYICSDKDIKQNPKKFNAILKKIGEENYWVIEYDDYISELKGKTIHKYKAETKTTCYFLKNKRREDGTIIVESMGIIPRVLLTLLDKRKSTRKLIKLTDDEFKKKVLDGFQLAYKVTANSVYGQMGAKTSSVFFKKIAACTTAIGRERIYDAEKGVKDWAIAENYNLPEVIYGDTDSVFVKFSRKHHETGEVLEGKEALRYCIDQGVKAGEWITKYRMSKPQDLEYEKTFYPFILISKKRYTGDKYELSVDKPKERTSMGLVTKRRDNAPIVKYVFGNIIEIIMNQRSVDKAFIWLKDVLEKIKKGKMDQSMFIISKSLRGYYKNPGSIAHKVLADRMAERNPGNKPKPNDRIPYAYIKLKDTELYDYNNLYKSGKNKGKPKPKKILQGDRVEHPDFIREKNIKLDYGFYISNQIMNPVKQVLDLEKSSEETKMFFEVFIN